MGPCTDASTTKVVTETNSTLAIALGTTFGVLFALALIAVLYMRSREKKGAPVFKTEEVESSVKA
eukprot:scaffold15814_cov111-Skeletonema_dohrnii-CCMP3373.AAC.1